MGKGNKMSFVLFSNGFLMFYRTTSNCSCWEKLKLLSLLPVTLPDTLKETHKPHNFVTEVLQS